MKRLLYLGISFPPGLQAMHPDVNPAGHAFETQMVAALRPHFEIRSATTLPLFAGQAPADADPASGVAHQLILQDCKPELWRRTQSLLRLKRQYLRWCSKGWRPDAVLVYNMSPIYNQFVRWLRRRMRGPKLVLLLLDSTQLGESLPPFKRFRYRLKPFTILEDEMLGEFDACIGLSTGVEQFALKCGQPFLWMPGACTPARRTSGAELDPDPSSQLRFGYFGALATHAGVMEFVNIFLQSPIAATLHICGYGKLSGPLSQIAGRNSRLQFHGLLPTPDDCLRFGQSCDVLVNPRPLSHGNANNFPSKLFEYSLCGRAILTSRLSGADRVLGADGFYFDPASFESNLGSALHATARCSRVELAARGERIRQRITTEYSWPRQAARMAEFIKNQVLSDANLAH